MARAAEDRGAGYFDLADPAFSLRSAQVRRAREAGWYARTSYGLAVLRYDQVARLIRHPDLRQGSVAWPAHNGITAGPFADWWAGWVLNKEGEDHQRLRRLLNPAFSRRLVDAMAPRFLALATELADGFAESGRCEFMAEFAEPYAARVIAIMLGIGEQDWRLVAADAATVGLALGVRIRKHLPRIETALAPLRIRRRSDRRAPEQPPGRFRHQPGRGAGRPGTAHGNGAARLARAADLRRLRHHPQPARPGHAGLHRPSGAVAAAGPAP